MTMKKAKNDDVTKDKDQPYRVRLPGFISDEEVGLGNAIKRATSAVGIRPCGGCGRRATALNRWMVFSGRAMKTANYPKSLFRGGKLRGTK
jgi:hypothetical protein